ncbi:hypothetical protein ACWDY7_26770 [Streptomyces calvus]|uniref:Uncharacterized protein n=1 Tax=Streptomyces calvus TaxID=67282 RepID=A0AA40SAD8_9ACTN|nr:hypothetical protein [Streptomyces calvus]MBA8942733.1 hypothetical protein [Streptomyces calvus]GGP83728.1 hypothetical protein GCM10010247_66450 [Streptomyces calvus]
MRQTTTQASVQPYPAGTLWTFRSLKSRHEQTEELALSWLPGRSSHLTDSHLPEETPATALWQKWLKEANHYHEQWPDLFRPGEVHLAWKVITAPPATHGIIEGAPYTRDERRMRAETHTDDLRETFLTWYTHPVHAESGERLNWLRLPVADRGWNDDRADPGGFVQEATGWKPSPLQLAMDVVQVARGSGLWTVDLALMSGELDPGEQYDVVGKLTTDIGSVDDEEFEALYAKLDAHHQSEVDESIDDFADNAVGDPSWRG